MHWRGSPDPQEALGKGFDYYAIMAYHRQTMNELNMDAKKAMDLMAEAAQKAVKALGILPRS